nr:hypothetical protein [Ideonella sp.]
RQVGNRPYCSAEDIRAMIKLPLSLGIAWFTPQERLTGLARLSLRKVRRSADTHLPASRRVLETLLSGRVAQDLIDRAVAEQAVHERVLQLHLSRCLRPGGWCPPVEFEGREHVDEAIARGHGAILWIAPLVYATVHAKVALARGGYSVSHLSRYDHGRFNSVLGIRWLNQIARSAEDRFLAERITIGPEMTALAATRLLAQRLRQNRIVAIAANREGATVDVPLLGGRLLLANGAPKIAIMASAPLLPVFSVRTEQGTFRTVIEPPLAADPCERDPVTALHAAFARRIEPYALRYPDQLVVGYPSSVITAGPSPSSPQG